MSTWGKVFWRTRRCYSGHWTQVEESQWYRLALAAQNTLNGVGVWGGAGAGLTTRLGSQSMTIVRSKICKPNQIKSVAEFNVQHFVE
jgi:hypothetical protein